MPTCMTSFSDVIQKAHRAQVIVVSPNILMLAINTIQTVMKDARMREQADLIRKEVGVLVDDVKRLGERVGNLQRHFDQAEADLKAIVISTDKIIARGEKIENVGAGAPGTGKSALGDLKRAARLEGGGQRAFVQIIEFAAHRHAMGQARHLDVAQHVHQIMRRGLALDRGVHRQDHFVHAPSSPRSSSGATLSRSGVTPSSADSAPPST